MVLCALAMMIGGPGSARLLHRPALKILYYLLRLLGMSVFNLLSLFLRLVTSAGNREKIGEAFAHFTERTADAFFAHGNRH